MNGLPRRHWKVGLCMLDEKEGEVEINIISNCTFFLHETFEEPVRSFNSPPFAVEEDGWGEFEMKIVCDFVENGGKFTIRHSLTFDEPAYGVDYDIKVPYHIPLLKTLLSKHFKLPDVSKDEKKNNMSSATSWFKQIASADQDVVTEVVQMIVSHPAVQAEVNKRPKHDDFLLGIHQLPNELVKRIAEYIRNTDSAQ